MSFVYELPYAVCNGRVSGVATLNSATSSALAVVTACCPHLSVPLCITSRGGRKRLPKFKFSAKFPIGLHVILQTQIKKIRK